MYKWKHLGLGVPFRVWPNKPNPVTECVTAACTEQAQPESLYCVAHDVAPKNTACEVEGCDRDAWYSGICQRDYYRWHTGGHGRSRYRTRSGRCEGRCAVCRWDHARETREYRLAALEQGSLHEQARWEVVARVWGGAPLEEVAAGAGLSVKQLWSIGVAWPEFVYALDAGLMATRNPDISHGTAYAYRVHGCRCPECRSAKAQNR
ncbi:hypothetical protein [Nocardiopsis synnemataformans]|uniref:hypothetical protein n=1 Tax=Nocardiopsis synnemataformans TaxID=61305 RepID=UPI003EB6C864